jgi:hypothetical protein
MKYPRPLNINLRPALDWKGVSPACRTSLEAPASGLSCFVFTLLVTCIYSTTSCRTAYSHPIISILYTKRISASYLLILYPLRIGLMSDLGMARTILLITLTHLRQHPIYGYPPFALPSLPSKHIGDSICLCSEHGGYGT